MKLDRIKFAEVYHEVSRYGYDGSAQQLDDLIDIQIEPKVTQANPDRIEDLLKLMTDGFKKIEAIKVFRDLTGAGLKESKDAIERYWIAKPIDNGHKDNGEATLGDILHASGRTKAGNNIG